MHKRAGKILAFAALLIALGAYVAGAGPFPLGAQGILPWSVWVLLLIWLNLVVWKRLMRVATFAVAATWSYALLGNIIPQSSSGPGPAMGDLERTPERFVAAGKALFYGKGKCSTCHVIGAGATRPRCPDLAHIGGRAGTRKPGMAPRDYLVESLYLPSAYVVEGYGNIMPQVWKPPIALTPLEIETLVAFLQSQGGEVDLSPIVPPVDLAVSEEAPPPALKGDPGAGRLVFEKQLQCSKCHRVSARGGAGGIGPDLSEIGALNTVEYIEESILDPNARIVPGFGSTTLQLQNGEELSGTLIREGEQSLTLELDEAAPEEDDWGWGEEEEAAADERQGGLERVVSKEEIALRPIADGRDLLGRGYFWIRARLDDGTTAGGVLVGEDQTRLEIKAGEGRLELPREHIARLEGRQLRVVSRMPEYDEVITVRQFEDLVAYLASLKGAAP